MRLLSCKALTLEMLGVQILANALRLIYQLRVCQVIFPGQAGSVGHIPCDRREDALIHATFLQRRTSCEVH